MGFTGIVGHEFVGVVEEVNNSRSGSTESDNFAALVGKRVVGEINLGEDESGSCTIRNAAA